MSLILGTIKLQKHETMLSYLNSGVAQGAHNKTWGPAVWPGAGGDGCHIDHFILIIIFTRDLIWPTI